MCSIHGFFIIDLFIDYPTLLEKGNLSSSVGVLSNEAMCNKITNKLISKYEKYTSMIVQI
jgi:hypothetical protein